MASDLEDYTSKEDKFLFAEAQVGYELEKFLSTNVGRYLVGRAEGVIAEFNEWVLAQPSPDTDEFKKRHLDARAMQAMIGFINEAVNNGKHAEKALGERDDQEQFNDGPLG